MDINCMKCPNCAGQLKTDLEHMKKICAYCDAQYYITQEEANQAGEPFAHTGTFLIRMEKCINKVKMIKVYRELTGLGLKEAKGVIDKMPGVLFSQLDENTALKYMQIIKTEAQESEIVMEVE